MTVAASPLDIPAEVKRERRTPDATTFAYTVAFDRMAANDAGARAAFAGLLGATPDDPLANFHLRRLLNGQTGVAVDLR